MNKAPEMLSWVAALAVLGRTRGQRHTSKQQQIVESIIQVTSTIYIYIQTT